MAPTELSRDHLVFAAAMAVETAHMLDDGLRGQDVASVVVALAIGVAAVALYGRLVRGARAVLAALFGLAGFVGALDMHVIHAIEQGASGADYTGFAHFAAGLTLLALSATLALRKPSTRGQTPA
jgi:hypothetical protein